jgi:3-oxoacyl-[acyl-carrier-protein] synthase II
MQTRRVVVTGLGAVCPVGNSVPEAWTNIKNGCSGVGWLTKFDTSAHSVKYAGEVKGFDPVGRFGAKEARRVDIATLFAWAAADEALRDSGLVIDDSNTYDVGCILGTCVGGIESLVESIRVFDQQGQKSVSPFSVPRILIDGSSAKISMEYRLRGPNYSVTSACATGNNAIGDAADLIRLGRAKVMLAGGTEAALVPSVLAGFANMRALSDYNGDDPRKACRPFDLNRSGFVAGEGAACILLEDYDYAVGRGARIYAELVGYGHTSDAYHITAPREDAEGATRAIRQALHEAGMEPGEIDYINAHGTGTPLNDKAETLAIKQALGERAYQVPISSSKSMTGHLLGAAGALEAIVALKALAEQLAPPTINLDTPDPLCDLDYVPHTARPHRMNAVMSNSFGFGGHNTALVFKRVGDS